MNRCLESLLQAGLKCNFSHLLDGYSRSMREAGGAGSGCLQEQNKTVEAKCRLKRIAIRISFVGILAVWLIGAVSGQVVPGTPSFSSYDTHEVDSVNLMSNNILLSFPIRSKSGATAFSLGATADSYVYVNSGYSKWLTNMQGGSIGAGFNASANDVVYSYEVGYATATLTTCNGDPVNKMSNWYIITGNNTYHWLPATDFTLNGSGAGCVTSITDQTVDGSGITISATGGAANAVYMRNGARLSNNLALTSLTDSNGNALTFNGSSWIDTLGLDAVSTSGGTNPNYSWTDSNGGTPTVTPSMTNLTLQTAFGCQGLSDITGVAAPLTTGVAYPDGTSLGFTYEATPGQSNKYTGRVQQITLREGGTVAYTYGGGGTHNGINCTYQTVPVLTRTLGNGDKTTYSLAYSLISGSSYKAVNTVVDPGGNTTTYQFTGFTSTGNAASPTAQVLTQVQKYLGNCTTSCTLLTTDVYCYNTAFASCSFTGAATATATYPITKVVVMHEISGMSTWSATETHYDNYGDVTYSAQYDFGLTTPTQFTTTTFGTWNGTTCVAIGNQINDKPCDVLTKLNGNTVAESHFTYDSHGNLLTTSLWTGSRWIGQTTANSYNSNGTPIATYDVANVPTNYGYNPADYVHCSSCTQYPFPTSISIGGLTTSATWDGWGGVKLTDVDTNGQTTTYGYKNHRTQDEFWIVPSRHNCHHRWLWSTDSIPN